MSETIGIIAGSGQFPKLVAQDARAAGLGVVICGFTGHTDPALADQADAFTMLHIGQLDKMLSFFHKHKAQRVCMAGAISKPKVLDFRPDLRAAKILFSLRGKGDDTLLRAAVREFEKEGFRVVPASSFSSSLVCPRGVLTPFGPDELARAGIVWGWPIAATLGRYDIGQCMVVRQEMVVAIECLEGTDATLRRGGELGGKGCVAIKRFKPGQDDRVDLPSVGLGTVRVLIEYGYSCLAIEAGKTLFFDREQAVEEARKHKLCIVALTDEDIAGMAVKMGN